MRPRWLSRTAALLAACVLAGCTTPGSSAAEKCGEPLEAEPGELRTVLQASAFGPDALILGSAALPDGSVAVAYDANPEEAGGEENWTPEPGLVLLRPDGSCEQFATPVVDGVRVALDAQPVAVDPDGRLYLWEGNGAACASEGAACRLVRGPVSGSAWELVATVPPGQLRYVYTPDVAVGQQGEVYIATDFLVSRVTGTGMLEPLAGTGTRPPGSDFPTPELGAFPRPGTSAPLTHLTGIAATPTGGVLITMQTAVLELDASGTLDLVADPTTTAGQEGAIEARHNDATGAEAGSGLFAPAVTDSGDVLVGDLPKKRILRIRDGRSTVVLTDSSYLSLSEGEAALAADAGLLLHKDGGQSLAVYGL